MIQIPEDSLSVIILCLVNVSDPSAHISLNNKLTIIPRFDITKFNFQKPSVDWHTHSAQGFY